LGTDFPEVSDLHPQTGREESESERVDRNLQEMLGELRVALPGVQVLFAFLLVVPFNQRFGQVTDYQRTLYLVTLLVTTASTVCLIAPTAHHRLEFRRQDKDLIVRTGNRIVIAGLGLLAIAMTGAVMFVTDVLYSTTTSLIVAGGVALTFALLWFGIPLRRLGANR
jgi:predicted neutral ceramidase superfamily lipid hydrolase